MKLIVTYCSLQGSVEDIGAMYQSTQWCSVVASEGKGRGNGPDEANAASSTDVTDSAPSLPSLQQTVTLHSPFEDVLDEPDYDRLSDLEELKQCCLIRPRHPTAPRRRAMATDFSEGRLETFVGSPQKELPGTQNQYVSYLVTTKVGSLAHSCGFVLALPVSNT